MRCRFGYPQLATLTLRSLSTSARRRHQWPGVPGPPAGL